ncbi:MAG: Eco57I restriction-modification methylase domain-containing protein [Janthinobacterium lividum]
MRFPTIRIEGSILSADILDKLENADLRGQLAKDFGLPPAAKVKEEIVRAWTDAQGLWRVYKRQMELVAHDKSGTTETRRYWMLPLLGLLGYNPELLRDVPRTDDKTYPISHADASRGNLPLHIMGFNDSLDKRRESGGPRLSPHALVQEYLNLYEHLYGLVTNGLRLRLLRDSSRLVRLSFVEFDLERMFDEDHFADFAILYRLLHATRLPAAEDQGSESLIEFYHQEALEAGSRIREGLSNAVFQCLTALGNGFVQHPDNIALRELLEEGKLTPKQYHHALLRLIYRLLFLLVIEERHLLFPVLDLPAPGDEAARLAAARQQAHQQVYQQYYSLARLRRLCEQPHLRHENRFADLWQGLVRTFRLFESELQGKALSIRPLSGQLFGANALGVLTECQLPNHVLLGCLQALNEFRNPITNQKTRVNYGALDVEEFGSVYEGLLDYQAEITPVPGRWAYHLLAGTDRAASGSHYTPEQLVQPLIRHSLDHVISHKLATAKAAVLALVPASAPSQRGGASGAALSAEIGQAQAAALLTIRICDVACGSGHMLLSAARRLAVEVARARTQEDQPSPSAQRQAQREVIGQCIYGVDYNPLAVELCKVALWLEAHNPGKPLSFLDHHIRCGNAVVGLARAEDLDRGIANAAFKTLPGDDKNTASALRKRNKAERDIPNQTNLFHEAIDADLSTLGQAAERVRQMPDHTTAEIEAKGAAFSSVFDGTVRHRLELLAHLQVAPFFTPKTPATADKVLTDAIYRQFLTSKNQMLGPAIFHAPKVGGQDGKKFFHWFLEFPDVMEMNGGFDVVLGNPPFLGGQRLSGAYGDDFLNWVKTEYAPAGSVDVVTYFFRRIYDLLRPGGFMCLISTNTIAQGSAREGGLDIILAAGGQINFAVRSMKWPGLAAVEVALVGVQKPPFIKVPFELDNQSVEHITSYLDGSLEGSAKPFSLLQNADKSFQGSIVLGGGFVLTPAEASVLINLNSANANVIQPYLTGDDLNNRPDQSPSRWVINFRNWPLRRFEQTEWNNLDELVRQRVVNRLAEGSTEPIAPPDYEFEVASDYPDCLSIVEEKVKPERIRVDGNGEFVLRKPLPQLWWIYGEKRPGLYSVIARNGKALVINRYCKYTGFFPESTGVVFTDSVIVVTGIGKENNWVINSNFFDSWLWKYCSTMGTGTLRFTPTSGFETFPFPHHITDEHSTMLGTLGESYYEYRRQLMLDLNLGLTKTYNLFHTSDLTPAALAKDAKLSPEAIPRAADLFQRLLRLRELQRQLDEAVATVYGWADLSLAHGFYEQDYLPENDRTRYTISPAARREVLRRLLQLNHEIHAQEVAEQAALAAAAKAAKPARKSKAQATAPLPLSPAHEVVEAPLPMMRVLRNEDEEVELPMAAESAQVIPTRRTAKVWEVDALVCEIIDQLQGTLQFGRTELVKALTIIDYEALPNVELGFEYKRQAAGPYDKNVRYKTETHLADNKWYRTINLTNGGARYEPMNKHGEHRAKFEQYWGAQRPAIDRILTLFQPLNLRQSEVVATLYVAWNDLLLDGMVSPSDDRIIKESSTEWHLDKAKITPQDWAWGLQFLRQNNLVPSGRGHHSRASSKP